MSKLKDVLNDMTTIFTKKILQEDNDNDNDEMDCICPECGFQKNLDIDEADCNEIACPKCGFPAMANNKEDEPELDDDDIRPDNLNESFENMVGNMVCESLHPIPDPSLAKRYICPDCRTILPKQIAESEETTCPKCGHSTIPMFEDVSIDEKRFNCLTCNTSYLYERTMEPVCKVCNGLMDVYTPTPKKTKS